jgi:hypothetical protein
MYEFFFLYFQWTTMEDGAVRACIQRYRRTGDGLFGPLLGEELEVLQGNQDPLDHPKHGGEAQTEEHDEEEHRPQWGEGHLGDGLREHDEG